MTDSQPQALIHARGLVKKFGDFVAVDGIDLDVEQGEAFGFLGPNGAGKSSTMRMIGCVSPPTAGTLRILGLDPRRDGPKIEKLPPCLRAKVEGEGCSLHALAS